MKKQLFKKSLLGALSSTLLLACAVSAAAPKVGADVPSKLTGTQLADRMITMKYCDFYEAGDYVTTYTFYREGEMKARVSGEEGPYGDAYGNPYGDNGYGNAYENGKGVVRGFWSLTPDEHHIQVKLDNSNSEKILYFGTRSYYQHRCYSEPVGTP